MSSRIALLSVVLLGFTASDPIHAAGQAALRDRCTAAIDASGNSPPSKGLKETAIPLGDQGVLFQFTAADGGVYSCQVCDDDNPAMPCGSMGLELSFRPRDGELEQLPARDRRKSTRASIPAPSTTRWPRASSPR